MIEIVKYNPELKDHWDQFILLARVDTFLFYRNYMDYHADRFIDHSFLFFRKGKLEGVLPGNLNGSTFYSYQGLTYGGLVTSSKITATDTIEIFKLVNNELKRKGVNIVIYKPIPWIYHKIPSQEDIYALFRLKAEKIECNLSSTIFQNNKVLFSESRKSGIRKGRNGGVLIGESENFDEFWNVLEVNLINKHGKKPVHDVSEIKHLKSLFPNNITLFVASLDREVVAGCLLFVMKNIVHVQYMACNSFGKKFGALDLLLDEVINKHYAKKPVFDFGHSNEQMGALLNENLIFQKEGFGGRGIVYETYKYEL